MFRPKSPRPNRIAGLIAALALSVWGHAAYAEDEPPVGEVRDSLMMFPSRPVHVRLFVALGRRPLSDVQEEYIDRMFETLDTDDDGTLTAAELAKSPFRTSKPAGGNSFLARLNQKQTRSRRDVAEDVNRVANVTVSYKQDDSASTNDEELFRILDVDGSGRVESGEMRTAALRILEKDSDRDHCVTFDEFIPVVQDPNPFLIVAQPDDTRPQPTPSELMRDAEQILLARDVVQKYDGNRDRTLSAGELGWSDDRIGALDRNGDQVLDQSEFARFAEGVPDLQLAVELSGDDEVAPIRVLAEGAPDVRVEGEARPDLITLEIAGVSLTLAYRKTDPIQDAVDNAMQMFNQLDGDANGYLDEDEAAARGDFFLRGVFREADRDGDEKLFGEEMQQFVTARAEPVANTCRVNIYNTGFGFFQRLDTSGDGRISVREMRIVESTLRNLVPDGEESLSPQSNGRHLHVEFVRNAFQLFGRSTAMVAQTPSFNQRPPVGPEWFKAMDRNSDGDLTYWEFIGHPEEFHALDADSDGLVDFKEAERASTLWPSNDRDEDRAGAAENVSTGS